MLYFIKESSENDSRNWPYDDNDFHNTLMAQNSQLLQEDFNTIKDQREITEIHVQPKKINRDAEKDIKNINSSSLSTNLKRKRKLLSQMWDNYYKVREKATFGIRDKTNAAFNQVGNDIFVYSVFYDDRKIYKNKNPVLQIVAMSKLKSESTLLCKFSTRGDGEMVQAIKHELSDNHDKLYGGVLYTCNIPHTLAKTVPKTIHLQSCITHNDNISKVTSTLVSMEVIWIATSNWKSAIYQDTNNLKKSLSGSHGKDSASNFLETFPKSHVLRKNQTIDKSQKSSPEIDQGGQLDSTRIQSHEELPTTRNNKLTSVSVCVPPLFGNIKLSEFIQFVEIHRILGVSKIFFYKMNVSSDIEQMLNYYQSKGMVTVCDWVLPVELQDSKNVWYNGQTTAQQDCLYRSMGKYDYTTFIDLDEVIVSKTTDDWPQMLENLDKTYSDGENSNTAAFLFKSAFFEPDNTIYKTTNLKREKLSFLEKSFRTEVIGSKRSKVIVKSAYIEVMGIHHVSKFVNTETKLKTIEVPVSTAIIHHYRKCTEDLDSEMHCGKYVADETLFKYSDKLIKNYEEALDNNMKYFKTIR